MALAWYARVCTTVSLLAHYVTEFDQKMLALMR